MQQSTGSFSSYSCTLSESESVISESESSYTSSNASYLQSEEELPQKPTAKASTQNYLQPQKIHRSSNTKLAMQENGIQTKVSRQDRIQGVDQRKINGQKKEVKKHRNIPAPVEQPYQVNVASSYSSVPLVKETQVTSSKHPRHKQQQKQAEPTSNDNNIITSVHAQLDAALDEIERLRRKNKELSRQLSALKDNVTIPQREPPVIIDTKKSRHSREEKRQREYELPDYHNSLLDHIVARGEDISSPEPPKKRRHIHEHSAIRHKGRGIIVEQSTLPITSSLGKSRKTIQSGEDIESKQQSKIKVRSEKRSVVQKTEGPADLFETTENLVQRTVTQPTRDLQQKRVKTIQKRQQNLSSTSEIVQPSASPSLKPTSEMIVKKRLVGETMTIPNAQPTQKRVEKAQHISFRKEQPELKSALVHREHPELKSALVHHEPELKSALSHREHVIKHPENQRPQRLSKLDTPITEHVVHKVQQTEPRVDFEAQQSDDSSTVPRLNTDNLQNFRINVTTTEPERPRRFQVTRPGRSA